MCNPTGQKITGGILYILGLLVAGVMFMIIGAEYNKDDTDNDKLRDYFWGYSISLLLGAIGLVLENGDRFCGEEEVKNVAYFGGLFQVCAVFAWSALGVGFAHFYDSAQAWIGGTPAGGPNLESADERASFAYMSGVASIFFGFGSLFVLKKLLCCEGNFCDMEFILSLINMFLMILLTVCWFLYAVALEDSPLEDGDDEDDRRTYSYLIGVVFLIMGIFGVLKILGALCNDDKPDYDNGYDDGYDMRKGDYNEKPGYDKPGYDKPGYGGNDGGYGDDTTTGYGQPQQPQY